MTEALKVELVRKIRSLVNHEVILVTTSGDLCGTVMKFDPYKNEVVIDGETTVSVATVLSVEA